MNIANLGKSLIAVAIFLFALATAIYFGNRYSQRGQIDKDSVFCLACLETQYYKTKTWKWESEPDYKKWQQLVYIPADVSMSERALLAKILTNFSNVAVQERFQSEPLAPWADQFFRAWGRARPKLKIRIPYFARIENGKPDWPSEPEQDFFGAVVSDSSANALILISPTQTEFDATLSIVHALFRLFDPANTAEQLDFSPELKNYWLDFRAFICEVELWHLFKRFFESQTLSYYHYQNYSQFWQQIRDGNYFDFFAWTVARSTKSRPLQAVSVFQVLPALQGKMPVQKVDANFEIGTLPEIFSHISGFKYLNKDSSYDGVLFAANLAKNASAHKSKDETLKSLISSMKELVTTRDKNFTSEDPKVIFVKFYEILGEHGVALPKTFAEDFNSNVRGEF